MRLINAGLLALYTLLSSGHEILSIPTWAPVSVDAPPLNNAGYRVESFGGGAYMVTDNQYNSLFFVSTHGVIVVDAPPTIGHNIAYAIGNITDKPVTHFIYSHSHSDHVGGAYLFQNVIRIAHTHTKGLLAAASTSNEPLPEITFKDKYTVRNGNQTLELSYKGPNHEPGNIFIYAPRQKVLMLVDVVFPGWAPFAYLALAEDIPGFIRAHDQILEYKFDHFVGGHLTRSGDRSDVLAQRDYIADLKTNCANAINLSAQPPNASNPISAQEMVPAALKANPGNPWAAFKVYLDNVADYCNNVTNQKWVGRLSGVDVWGPENAFAMVESLRLDFDVLGPFGVTN
ncbi:beta-lactamase-like protein [Trichoderma barbatum]